MNLRAFLKPYRNRGWLLGLARLNVGFDAGETSLSDGLDVNESVFGREKNGLSRTKNEMVTVFIGEACFTSESTEDHERVDRTVVCAQGLREMV